MRDIVDVMLAINCQAYSFEAGNVRHEHEWNVWQRRQAARRQADPAGVVSHATNVVEHPELVAERISASPTWWDGRTSSPRPIAAWADGSTLTIAWAKLDTLAQGAELASRQLWGRSKAA